MTLEDHPMSLESGRKFGYYASLMNVILPIVSIGIAVALVFSIIASITRGIISGTAAAPSFLGVFSGLIIFIVVIGVAGVIAYVMFMYAMYSLSKYYKEPTIFKNVLYALILSIISAAVIFSLEFAVIIAAIAGISQTNTPSTTAVPAILSYVVVIVVALAFGVVNGLLYLRSFNKIKEKSGVDNFGTAGLLYIIGVFIPFIMWIAWIFAAMGFNNLKTTPITSQIGSYHTQPSLSSTIQTKRCPNCGTENIADSIFCSNCGKPL
jgi:uncharacterized membrane protein